MPGGKMPAKEYGRPASAPGVGKDSKRHDLERRSVPTLAESDLQQGDVSMLQQGLKVAPVGGPTIQAPAAPQGQPQGQATAPAPGGMETPDPIEFIGQRYGTGALGLPAGTPMTSIDVTPWLPMLRAISNSPNAGGILQTAFIRQLRNAMMKPMIPDVTAIDLNDLDAAVETYLDNSESL